MPPRAINKARRQLMAQRIRKLSRTMSKTEICLLLKISDPTVRHIAAEFGIEFPVTTVGSNQHGPHRKESP